MPNPVNSRHLSILRPRQAQLPEAIRSLTVLWSKMGEAASTPLSRALGTDLSCLGARVAVESDRAYRAKYEDPGLLITIEVRERGPFFIRTSIDAALKLAMRLLRTADQDVIADHAPELLDGLLMTTIVTPILDQMETFFDVPARCLTEVDPLTEWPLMSKGPSVDWLCVSIDFEAADGDAFSFELLLPADEVGFRSEEPEKTILSDAARAAVLASEVRIEATLDRRTMPAHLLSRLAPGTLVQLEGASTDRISLSLPTRKGPVALGHGEHGRSRGFTAVRLTDVSSLR